MKTKFESIRELAGGYGQTTFESLKKFAENQGYSGEFSTISEISYTISENPPTPTPKTFTMTAGNSQGIEWNTDYESFTVCYDGGLYDGLTYLPFSCKLQDLNCEVWDVDGIEGQGTHANPYVIYWYKMAGNPTINAWEPYSFRNITDDKITGTNVKTASGWIANNMTTKRIENGYIAINIFRDATTIQNTSTSKKWIAAYSGSTGIEYLPVGDAYARNMKPFKGLYRDLRIS